MYFFILYFVFFTLYFEAGGDHIKIDNLSLSDGDPIDLVETVAKTFSENRQNPKRFDKCVNMWYRIPIHGMMMMITIDSGRCWFLKVALWWWVCGSAFEVTRLLYHHIIAIITSPPPPSPPSSPLSPSPSPSPPSSSQLSGGACSRRL